MRPSGPVPKVSRTSSIGNRALASLVAHLRPTGTVPRNDWKFKHWDDNRDALKSVGGEDSSNDAR